MDKYLEKLDYVSNSLIQQLVELQRTYITNLSETLDSDSGVTPKTIVQKTKKAKKMWHELLRVQQEKYKESQISFFKDVMDTVGKDEGIGVNFDAVPWEQINQLAKTGLVFMQNYEDDIVKFVKSQLYVSLLNGESYRDALNRIKPIGNNKARPAVMIRDQMSRIYQSAINTVYKGDPDKGDYVYMWTGPTDSRTTEICKARKAKNPYSIEDVEKLDPHPHIQCRHRWVRKSLEIN